MKRLLFIGDPHFTDNPSDSYRFGIFPWIKEKQKKLSPDATIILGDITDKKDKHSAFLTNKIVEGLGQLEGLVFVNMGNHDYIDPNTPFFKFLNNIKNVKFLIKPNIIDGIGFIPHCRNEDDFNNICYQMVPKKPDILVVHQTFEGALAETGAPLRGFNTAGLEKVNPRGGVYAGDAHRPQQTGFITYVGSPYTIRFGDDFEPRCLLLTEDGEEKNLYFKCPRKWKVSIKHPDDLLNENFLKGDKLKVTVQLTPEEIVNWISIKRDIQKLCLEAGFELHGVTAQINRTPGTKVIKARGKTHEDVYEAYCKTEKVPDNIAEAGFAILNPNV